jgi:hypothetical protein
MPQEKSWVATSDFGVRTLGLAAGFSSLSGSFGGGGFSCAAGTRRHLEIELAEREGLPAAKRGALRDSNNQSLQATLAFEPWASRQGSHPSPDRLVGVVFPVPPEPAGIWKLNWRNERDSNPR